MSSRKNQSKKRSGKQGGKQGGKRGGGPSGGPSGFSGDDLEIRGIPSLQSFVEDENGLWIVRKLTGSAANKPYRCPGCDQVIPMATPHTVAWLDGDEDGRRHWHNACWSKRNNRRPNTERTRNAPRY